METVGKKRKRRELNLPASVTTRAEKKYPAKVMLTGGLTCFGIFPNPPTNVGKFRRIRIDKRYHKAKVGRPRKSPLGRPKKARGKR